MAELWNSAIAVQATDTSNAAPEFKDDDGDAITSLDRSVEENTKSAGENVGDDVVATTRNRMGRVDNGGRRQFDLLAGRPRRMGRSISTGRRAR